MAGSEQKIVDRIIADAEERAAEIGKDARIQAEALKTEALEENAAKRLEDNFLFKSEAALVTERIISQAEMDKKKALLKVKNSIIEEVYSDVLAELTSLQPDSYLQLLTNIIVSQGVDDGDEIILAEKDKALGSRLEKSVNEALKKSGSDAKVRISEQTCKISGGCILSKGEIELNNSFEALLKSQKDRLDAIVAAELFKEIKG